MINWKEHSLPICVSVIALGLATIREFTEVKFDSITLVLLGVAAIPWMTSLVKAIELTGFGKLELNNLKQEMRVLETAAEDANKMVSQSREELAHLSNFVFECLINEKEVEVLKGLEQAGPYALGIVGKDISSQSLYQLRDSELIKMGSIQELKRKQDSIKNFHEHAALTEKGRRYLKYLHAIEITRKK